MESNTQQLLQELREDHRNMALVLDVLESNVEIARADDDPDFELIDEIMHYMTVYPDAVHHPKEDLVYATLRERRPDLAVGLDDVPAEHVRIAELGTQLRNDVEAIIAGSAVRRERFIEDASEYVDRLRRHMQWEEGDLFKRVDEIFAEEDPSIDVEKFQHIKDPVFGLEIESAFQRLVNSLRG